MPGAISRGATRFDTTSYTSAIARPEGLMVSWQNMAERRSNPRVAILGKLHGRAVALDVSVTVTEISLSGMGIQTNIPFPVDAVHLFQLTLGDNSVVHLKGRVKHCQKLDDEPERFLSGIQFLDEKADD
jgi:hypothetical protein